MTITPLNAIVYVFTKHGRTWQNTTEQPITAITGAKTIDINLLQAHWLYYKCDKWMNQEAKKWVGR